MSNDKLKSEANPSLVVLRDNKPKWYLPETRREGYRNLHKINRYGLLYRSDLVLKLNTKKNKNIENIPSVKKMVNHKYFCSLFIIFTFFVFFTCPMIMSCVNKNLVFFK